MNRIRLSCSGSIITADFGVVLSSELGTLVLENRDAQLLLDIIKPLLDGTHTRDEVVNDAPEGLRSIVSDFLEILERQGLLETVIDEVDNPLRIQQISQERFFRLWSDRPEDTTLHLSKAKVLIAGLTPWGITLATELAASGIHYLHILDDSYVTPYDLPLVRSWDISQVGASRAQELAAMLEKVAPWCQVTTSPLDINKFNMLHLSKTRWDLVIITANHNDVELLMKLAHFTNDNKLPSLFGSLRGLEAFIGPIVKPSETACWNCCRLRLLANSRYTKSAHAVQDLHFQQRVPNVHPLISLAPMAPLLGHILALEALKFLSRCSLSQIVGRLIIQNLMTLETTKHQVIPMPWCEVCGGARLMNKTEEPSSQWSEASTVEDLLESLTGWVDNRTGVISHLFLKDRTMLDLPVCAEAYLSQYTEGTYEYITLGGCGGKGVTSTEAMIGAVGEAIERYSASRVHLDELRCAPMHDLLGDILDPRQLCLYDEKQYDQPGFPFTRFNPNDSHLWALGHWLDNGEPVWVPALSAFMVFPLGNTPPFCQVTSNGLATGVDLDDAALRATFELIERDAFMLTWLCHLPVRRLIPDDNLEFDTNILLEQLKKCHIEVELYLLKVGLSIPSVVCLGFGNGKSWPAVTVSAAAHLSPRTAVRKAVLELGYTLYYHHLMDNGEHQIPERPEQIRTFRDHSLFYVPIERTAAFDFLRSPNEDPCLLSALREPEDISLAACAERLKADGVRIACVDVTSPDIARGPFRVVRAIGVNLQPIHCGYGMERLNNPRLRAFLSSEINPDPHPFS